MFEGRIITFNVSSYIFNRLKAEMLDVFNVHSGNFKIPNVFINLKNPQFLGAIVRNALICPFIYFVHKRPDNVISAPRGTYVLHLFTACPYILTSLHGKTVACILCHGK